MNKGHSQWRETRQRRKFRQCHIRNREALKIKTGVKEVITVF